jgi:hypothetical protein
MRAWLFATGLQLPRSRQKWHKRARREPNNLPAGLPGGQDDRPRQCLRDAGVFHALLWRAEHARPGLPAASR